MFRKKDKLSVIEDEIVSINDKLKRIEKRLTIAECPHKRNKIERDFYQKNRGYLSCDMMLEKEVVEKKS